MQTGDGVRSETQEGTGAESIADRPQLRRRGAIRVYLGYAPGCGITTAMLEEANRATRTPVPASRIMVGLQCGGSDGYSGISANPALGAAVDLLVRHGGTAILSETPEIYGAEHLLTRRAVSREVGEKLIPGYALVTLVELWQYFFPVTFEDAL